jgi:hypothetical protein
MHLDSFGYDGPLSPGILDRLDLLPEIRRLVELLGDSGEDRRTCWDACCRA